MAVCSKFCDGCDYLSRNSSGKHGDRRTCDYILITGSRRGCPAGAKCTKKRVGGVVIPPMARDIAEDVRAAKTRKPGSGCTSEGARRGWQKRFADPVYQMEQIRKWNAMSDNELVKLICDKRLWRRKWEAAHGPGA